MVAENLQQYEYLASEYCISNNLPKEIYSHIDFVLHCIMTVYYKAAVVEKLISLLLWASTYMPEDLTPNAVYVAQFK